MKTEQKQGCYICGGFDRVITEPIKKKDGSTFDRHKLYVLVQGKKRTEIVEINIRNPEKWQNHARGDNVEIEVYVSARVWEGRAFVSYYEVE